MDWYYALNDQQCGPVGEAQISELLQAGKIGRDTLVWNAGMGDWQPLHTVRSLPSPAIPPVMVIAVAPGTTAQCVECRGVFAQGDMLCLSQSWVCASCKPIFLQRLAEGAAPPVTAGGMWRSNRQLVTRSETPMPDRCVKCNAPANGFRLKRQLFWHHPAIYVLVLISVLIYAIVALIVRKKAMLHIGLCAAHRTQRKRTIAGCWLGALLGLGALIAGIGGADWVIGLVGAVVLLAALIVGAVRGGVVSAAKIDKNIVRVKGVCPDFLASLPEWNDMG